MRKKGQKGLEKFLSALRKSANAGNQPGHEELLQLFDNEYKDRCSSTTLSVEVNVSQNEAGDNDPQSNDQVPPVVQIYQEEYDDEPKVPNLEGHLSLEDTEGKYCKQC